MFVDIEFNREGITFKKVAVDGQDEKVRPDIIVHNRMSNGNKFNLLVVECKKNGADDADIQWDVKKIKVLIRGIAVTNTFLVCKSSMAVLP